MEKLAGKCTIFKHPLLKITNGLHGQGVVSTNRIPMGSILLIESGLFNVHKSLGGEGMTDMINKHRNDPYFRDIFDNLCFNDNAKHFYDSSDIDVQRFIINSFGGDIYPFLSKINHGFPTNIAVFRSFGDANESVPSKVIVIATDDIKESDELCFDYFNIANITVTDESFDAFAMNRKIHSDIEIEQNIYDDFIAADGKYNYINSQTLLFTRAYKGFFKRIVNDIYLNGISHSVHFAEIDQHRICERKRLIKNEMFSDAELFAKIAQSNMEANEYNDIIQSFESNLSSASIQLRQLLQRYHLN